MLVQGDRRLSIRLSLHVPTKLPVASETASQRFLDNSLRETNWFSDDKQMLNCII